MSIKIIDGYDYVYFITSDGRVFSSNLNEMKGSKSRGLYKSVTFKKGGRQKSLLVHRLVADAFCEKNDTPQCVNHIDGNKHNNHASNLEWCTLSENSKHAFDMGLKTVPMLKRENHPMAKVTEKKVSLIRKAAIAGEPQSSISKRMNIDQSQVSRIVNHKSWKGVL